MFKVCSTLKYKGRFPIASDERDTVRFSTAGSLDCLNARFYMLLYVAFARPMSERVSNQTTGAPRSIACIFIVGAVSNATSSVFFARLVSCRRRGVTSKPRIILFQSSEQAPPFI